MGYAIDIERAESNFSAYVRDLPGCVVTGATPVEAALETREAMAFQLGDFREDGRQPLPAASVFEYVEIAA